MKCIVILPAFNESKIIDRVLLSLPRKIIGVDKIEYVIINDGSTDRTEKIAVRLKFKVINHLINRGLGAAIKTGLEYAKSKNTDIAVTFDSDGQHDPDDIARVMQPIIKHKADLVIGTRFRSLRDAPTDRLILNWFANISTFLLFGAFTTDSQSGLRAFSKKALKLINYKADRMEFSSEIIAEANKHNLKVFEVPIKAIYTDYSRKKGQKNLNALPIFFRHLTKLFR